MHHKLQNWVKSSNIIQEGPNAPLSLLLDITYFTRYLVHAAGGRPFASPSHNPQEIGEASNFVNTAKRPRE